MFFSPKKREIGEALSTQNYPFNSIVHREVVKWTNGGKEKVKSTVFLFQAGLKKVENSLLG